MVLAVLLLAITIAIPVSANYSSTLGTRYCNEDSFYNYDFTDPSYVGPGYNYYVDQPVMVVFAGNANKTSIRNAFWVNFYQYTGSPMYNSLNNGAGWVANSDTGRKTDWSDMSGYHYRLYAAGDSYMYNATWGNYVLATTHCDFVLGGGFGWNEYVEYDLYSCAAAKG
jgi:hypothetical protein